LQGLLAEDPLAVDERAVRAAQVAQGQPAVGVDDLTMSSADLGRLDPDDAVVMPPEAGHPIGQPQRGRGTTAPDDLEYIVHRNEVPIECGRLLVVSAEMGILTRLSCASARRKWGNRIPAIRTPPRPARPAGGRPRPHAPGRRAGCRSMRVFSKTACNPGSPP